MSYDGLVHYLLLKWCSGSSALFTRTNRNISGNKHVIHVATWTVSRRLNILCIMFTIRTLFKTTLFFGLCARVGILFTCWKKRLHNRIISLKSRGTFLAPKTSLTPSLFIDMPVQSQQTGRSCLCMRCVGCFFSFSMIIFDWIVELYWQCGTICFSFSCLIR
jgi:hypothetical protein